MCGVIGVANSEPEAAISAVELSQALMALRHRGPDVNGVYQNARIALGHTRLSILDLSPAGKQPMRSANGRFVISYNGEVYNFNELAKQYKLEGLRSGSDTEVVLRLFAERGVASLAELNGMFSFAIADLQKEKLWLVRDRLGIKPLYYRSEVDRLIFASEIKGIAALSPGASLCNVAALHEWLYFGNSLGGRTLHAGIEQVLPGHYLEVDLKTLKRDAKAYWSPKAQAASVGSRESKTGEVLRETRRLLEQAVRRQLVSDVPIGVFLSGGVDSSAIVAFASRHYKGRLATYSSGFDFARGGGELPRAKRVAAHFGTDHHEIFIAGGNVADLIEKLVLHHDTPFADAANIPLYLLAMEVGAHTKVVLQGDGGDELFGGYRRYCALSHYRFLRPLARALLHLDKFAPKSPSFFRVQRYLRAFAAEDVATVFGLLLTNEDRALSPASIFSGRIRGMVEKVDPFARHRECQSNLGEQDLVNQMSLVDIAITLPDLYLEKVDRPTMAASLEVRVPFLDHDLVDFVIRLSGRTKVPHGKQKGLLKSALKGVVPAEVLNGRKSGLEVPYGKWLQGALKPFFFDHLATFSKRYPDVLDVDYVGRLFRQTGSGGRDDSFMLWKVLNFMVWANQSKLDFSV